MIYNREKTQHLTCLYIFISQSYFTILKNYTLLYHKKPNKRELQQIAINHSSDTEFKEFIKLYKDYTKALIFSNDTTLPSDDQL